ncbi:hypothetical protein, partial [Kitasatospora sp. NPDC059817]|uniref:hypothetical protein n=1 Tax=Kitasatospora sp. NPDC059817 TaxID=3346961 RepID=UPI003658F05E
TTKINNCKDSQHRFSVPADQRPCCELGDRRDLRAGFGAENIRKAGATPATTATEWRWRLPDVR